LRINGIQITAHAQEAFSFISGLYQAGEFTFDALLVWLTDNTIRID